MKLVFFGSGAFGLPTLQHLQREHDVALVVTQPDKPAGRKRVLTPTPIGEYIAAHSASTPIIKPPDVNVPEVRDHIRELNTDAWVVIAFGQKLSRPLLENVFAINLHASLLPRWRGAAPINHAILAGDTITGNSVITLADRMDAGLVLGQSKRPLESHLTTGELHDLLASDGPALVSDVLRAHAQGSLRPVTQNDSLVTIASKFTKADGWIEFSDTADACRRRIHGLNPWPVVNVTFRGEDLKLLRAESFDADTLPPHETPATPGTIVDERLGLIACGSGTILKLLEVQPANGRAQPWHDFANGRHVARGEMLVGDRHGG